MEDPGTCFVGQIISIFLTSLILFSCVCFILGTLPSLRDNEGCPTCEPEQPVVFDYLEAICVGVFTLEYVVRIALAPLSRSELLDYEKILELVTEHQDLPIPSCQRRLILFLVQPMNVIDLFVIVPYYLELIAGFVWSNLTVLRVLRLTRLFRLVKLGRYFEVLQLVVRVINKSLEVLNVLFIYLMLGMCFSAALMYVIEGGTWDSELQDYVRTSHEGEKTISPFKSIPHACWWCIVTFTTVGYGDVVPVTVIGKLVAACTMIAGVLVLAMPISAISLNFGQVWEEWVEERRLEAEAREVDVMCVTKAMQGMESRSRLLLELYDDCLGGGTPEFLGEVNLKDLPVDSLIEVTEADAYYELEANLEKKPSEKVSGELLVGYTWRPNIDSAAGDMTPQSRGSHDPTEHHNVRGTLEVRIQRAGQLPPSDWKKAGLRDIYVEVHCWPTPPNDVSKEEGMKSSTFRTSTQCHTLDPVWKQACTFEYDWPRDWRPVEEHIFNHARFWNGSTASFSGGSQPQLIRMRTSSGDFTESPGRARHPLRSAARSQTTPLADGKDPPEEEEKQATPAEAEIFVSPRRRFRTRTQAEQARLECIHGFYRQKSLLGPGPAEETIKEESRSEAGSSPTTSAATIRADPRPSPTGSFNALSRVYSAPAVVQCDGSASARPGAPAAPQCDEMHVPPLVLPEDAGELPALRRCVEDQGRELHSLSSRMVEMQSAMARMEALLLSRRPPAEADADQEPISPLQKQRVVLPTLLKGAAETSTLSAHDAPRPPEMPGCLAEGHPPD